MGGRGGKRRKEGPARGCGQWTASHVGHAPMAEQGRLLAKARPPLCSPPPPCTAGMRGRRGAARVGFGASFTKPAQHPVLLTRIRVNINTTQYDCILCRPAPTAASRSACGRQASTCKHTLHLHCQVPPAAPAPPRCLLSQLANCSTTAAFSTRSSVSTRSWMIFLACFPPTYPLAPLFASTPSSAPTIPPSTTLRPHPSTQVDHPCGHMV
jgi:hypothetical protein